MSAPTLTVVIPNYNHGQYLSKSLQALIERERPPDEVIIIDDGSTDNSWELIQELTRKYRSIRSYRNGRNLGVLPTVNRGLDLASGDFFYGAAADDYVRPGFFEKCMALLGQHPQAGLSCTIGDWQEMDTGLQWHVGVGMTDTPAYLSPDRMVELELAGRLFIAGHTCIVRRSALSEAGRFHAEVKYAGDWFTNYLIGFRHGICVVPEPLAVCQIHPNSYYKRGRRDRAGDAKVMATILRLLSEPRFSEPAMRMRQSGALYIWGYPMLRCMLAHREFRHFLNWPFLRKSASHIGKLSAKRAMPTVVVKTCLRLAGYGAKRTPSGSRM